MCSLGSMCVAQYEDPTDVVQHMREKIELQRALKLEWLVQLAARTAHDMSNAAGTSNGQSSEVTIFPISAAALLLALPELHHYLVHV